MPSLCRKPRLEGIWHDPGTEHADRMRPQMRVQAVAKASRHKMFRDIAMRDLPQRVHAGVGAAGAVNANVLAADRLDRGFQRALHRGAIILDLPAAERRAVIFDSEFVAGHQQYDLFRLSWPDLTGHPASS